MDPARRSNEWLSGDGIPIAEPLPQTWFLANPPPQLRALVVAKSVSAATSALLAMIVPLAGVF
jgi:hypothetical protein